MDLILRNARVRGHDKNVDIAVHDGLIAKIAPKITARPRQVIDCAGHSAWLAFHPAFRYYRG